MLTKDEIEAAAAALGGSEKSRRQIGLLSLKHPDMTMDDAYAVQAAWVKQKIASGRKVIGWKIGLTSKAMQYALNIDIPDSGVLFDDMGFEDGAVIPADRFIQPRIEAEIAFVMKAPLQGPNVSIFDVLNRSNLLASLQQHEQAERYADLYMTPPAEDQGFAAFDRVGEIAEIGYRYAVDRLESTDLSLFG